VRLQYLKAQLSSAWGDDYRPFFGVVWGGLLSFWAHLHSDWSYLYAWFILVFLLLCSWSLDFVVGSWLAQSYGQFSFSKWGNSLAKLVAYAVVFLSAVIVHVLGTLTPIGGYNLLAPFAFAMPACLILNEVGSVLKNLSRLFPGGSRLYRLFGGLGNRGERLAETIVGDKDAQS